jgi:ribonuclease-3
LNLPYKFKNKKLLTAALTHSSFAGEKKIPSKISLALRHNEKLEFLGDAVISLVLSEHLFNTELDEAHMSQARAVLVKGPALARLAKSINLYKHILLGKGEEATGGRAKASILAGAFEAVMGAVYLDGGYEEAKRTVLELFQDTLTRLLESGKYHDAKTELQEYFQKHFGELPVYKVIKEEGREHEKIFTSAVFFKRKLYGKGKGRTKKEAETEAASQALEKLGQEENR